MCALFGWYKPDLPARTDRARLLKHLARKSQARGESSFGMATVKDGKPKIVRHIGPASTWLEANKKSLEAHALSDIVVGHTRQPTKGAVTKANTHPFTIGEWAAAHNGCISNSSSLMTAALYAPRGETDSEEALCFIISADWDPEALDKITGSYAFAGVKADGSEVVLVCDSVQSLHYVRFGDGLVWATDGNVLKSSLAAVGIDAEPVKMKKQVIRIPAWTTQAVDDKTYTTGSYGGHTGHTGYTGGSGRYNYKTKKFEALDSPKTSFPAVAPDPDKDAKCDGCAHAYSDHTGGHGCLKSEGDRICPCAEFTKPDETKLCSNPHCLHPAVRHNTSWGCMKSGCNCTEGKLPLVSTPPAAPNANTVPEVQDDLPIDVDRGEGEMISEAEIAALRASQGAVDMG